MYNYIVKINTAKEWGLNMVIRAKTHYNEKLLKDFAKFNFFIKPKILMAFLILLEICIAAVYTMLSIQSFNWATLLTGIFCFLISPLTMLFSYHTAVKSLRDTLSGTTVEFEFEKTEFRMKASNTGLNGESTVSYKNLYKVYEKGEYFYIYSSKYSAIILRKSDIIEGNAEKLKNILKEFVPFKEM